MQGEALAMSDRISVFAHGRIEQTGTPVELYEKPATGFVASFVGVSNLVDRELASRLTGGASAFTIRPERVRLLVDGEAPPPDALVARGSVEARIYLGATTRYTVRLEGGGLIAVVVPNSGDAQHGASAGHPVRVAWLRRHEHPLSTTS